jgi:hypothetical protein
MPRGNCQNYCTVDSCYVLRQFLTPLPSIDFREIRGLVSTRAQCNLMKCVLPWDPCQVFPERVWSRITLHQSIQRHHASFFLLPNQLTTDFVIYLEQHIVTYNTFCLWKHHVNLLLQIWRWCTRPFSMLTSGISETDCPSDRFNISFVPTRIRDNKSCHN